MIRQAVPVRPGADALTQHGDCGVTSSCRYVCRSTGSCRRQWTFKGPLAFSNQRAQRLEILMLVGLLVACAAVRLPSSAAGGSAARLARPGVYPDQNVVPVAPVQAPAFSGRVVSSKGPGQAPTVTDTSILVQGGSLRTWSYQSPYVDQVQVELSTEGRPLDADIELWHGPDNTPCKMRVYVENGDLRPFSTVIETPRGPNTVAIRNVGQMEFPFAATVVADKVDNPSAACLSSSHTIQGGALRTYPFETGVDSVQILLQTDGRPLNSRIELLQGPNNNKQVIELYTEDGRDRPFFCVLQTPGSGNVVRVLNTAPLEFPLSASVVPHLINPKEDSKPVMGGDVVISGGDSGW
eukprot:scaffold12925_cov131-Isochrysis_galbana.AAC.2